MSVFGEDIVLDEEAFETAIQDFAALSTKLLKLRGDLTDMMDGLREGFNTPAGVKFINACETNLFQPLDDQKLVIDHIASTLQQSKQAYESVFQAYEDLQEAINQVNNN